MSHLTRLGPSVLVAAAALHAQQAPASAPRPAAFPQSGVRIEADAVPIDVTVGHAAPYVIDFDGDGVRDLLVGEYGEGRFPEARLPNTALEHVGADAFALGKLRIYKNRGTNAAPRFTDFEYLKAGAEDASIPTT